MKIYFLQQKNAQLSQPKSTHIPNTTIDGTQPILMTVLPEKIENYSKLHGHCEKRLILMIPLQNFGQGRKKTIMEGDEHNEISVDVSDVSTPKVSDASE